MLCSTTPRGALNTDVTGPTNPHSSHEPFPPPGLRQPDILLPRLGGGGRLHEDRWFSRSANGPDNGVVADWHVSIAQSGECCDSLPPKRYCQERRQL
jgi:hypothetical protein